MVEAGRCWSLINKDVNGIKGMFRWAVEQELLPVTVYPALQAVAGLRKGRSEAREAEPVGPAPEEHVRATLPHLSPVSDSTWNKHGSSRAITARPQGGFWVS
jgi:hypothetical protein